MANNKYTDIQKDIILNNYISNGIDYCVTLTGLNRKQIIYLAHKIGVKMSSICKKSQIDKKRIHDTYNATLEISDPETAYLLGILWGDGHLKCSSQSYYPVIEILTKDFIEISQIFTKWIINNRQRPNRQPITVAILYDRNIGLYLLKHGYLDKSVNSPHLILSMIPTYLHNYFWRGYSDADGCFYINEKYHLYQYVICGNYEQSWKEMEILCTTLNIPFKIRRVVTNNNTKYSQFRIIGKDNVVRIGNYLYTGETFGLIRKYNKFCIIRDKCVDKNL